VLPITARQQLGLVAGQEIEVRVEEGRAILEPATVGWHVEKHGRVSVLVPEGPVPQLTDAEIREALDAGRDPESRHNETC
jgi:bifunctional DNA-binding transcriptional regulator/antitoxin component of YhaV-PrlF toxin-antitoxin module